MQWRRVKEMLELLRRIYSMPPIVIPVWGDEAAREFFRICTARHPRFPIFRQKTLGAALLDLTDERKIAVAGGKFIRMRQNRKKAIAKGFTVRKFDPLAHLPELMEIHASASVRQGHEINPNYLDAAHVEAIARKNPLSFGVFDADGVLRGYAHTPVAGDVIIFSRIMGHAKFNEYGIMYLLVSEVNKAMADNMKASGSPRWSFYDMYPGASSGLRFFKDHCGFEPRRVKWVWRDAAPR